MIAVDKVISNLVPLARRIDDVLLADIVTGAVPVRLIVNVESRGKVSYQGGSDSWEALRVDLIRNLRATMFSRLADKTCGRFPDH